MPENIDEILVSPLQSMIVKLGESVALASTALHDSQLQMIQSYPSELAASGFSPTIYHMQSVEVEMQLEFHVEKESSGKNKWSLYAAPLNASSKSKMQLDISGTSKLKMSFSPGPVPTIYEPD
jgi:hypothetical protein